MDYHQDVIMKVLVVILSLFLLTSCTEADVEELVFRKIIEYDLIELCGDDEQCKLDVKAQIKGCMVSSDWQGYIKNQDDDEELTRFTVQFYDCFVDPEGQPYFEANLD